MDESRLNVESAGPQNSAEATDSMTGSETHHVQTPWQPKPATPTPWKSAAVSTLTSVAVVAILLTLVRFVLPPLLEQSRYSWYRGQLRAQYDHAGDRLQNVSLAGLSEVSAFVNDRVAPSVVHIDVQQSRRDDLQANHPFADSDQILQSYGIGQGSGVIVDPRGYIVTNNHVLEDAEAIEVYLFDRRRVRATLVGSDSATDLAVLKIEADDLIPADWGDSDKLSVGSPVWAVGSPFGLSGSITFGIISSKHRVDFRGTRYQLSNVLSPRYGDLLQSDVAINPGNSGGPLVDANGSIVGINTAILGETYRGVSFAIPSHVARRCFQQIVEHGRVMRGWLGVELDVAGDPRPFELPLAGQVSDAGLILPSQDGATIKAFAERSSPARDAGLKIGDRIVRFNNQPVLDADALIRLIGEADIGVDLPLEIVREGRPLALSVQLGQR